MKIFRVVFLFVIIFHLSSSILIAETFTVKVNSSGSTKQEAIYAGLIEAVRQINGVKIASQAQTDFQFTEFSASNRREQHSGSKATSSFKKEIFTQSKGVIQQYEILNIQQKDDLWEAALSVVVPKYQTPGISPHSRRKIAVMPFRTTQSIFTIGNKNIPAQEISRQFSQKLVTELTQSRRFTVLDRNYINEYFREKNLLLSGDTSLEEQMRLGEVLGVDYMLVGTITRADIERTAYQIKSLGRTGYKDKATFIADYRIIVMPTRQIKWADSVTLALGNKELRQLAGNADPQALEQALLQRAAQMIAHKALTNIYPIRIAAIQPDGSLILNQGGVTVSDGELFDIFKAGEKVIDPYSGESLGAAETWVATAKVERVLAKQSYVKIIKGEQDQVKKGDICRRVSDIKSKDSGIVQRKEKKMAVPW